MFFLEFGVFKNHLSGDATYFTSKVFTYWSFGTCINRQQHISCLYFQSNVLSFVFLGRIQIDAYLFIVKYLFWFTYKKFKAIFLLQDIPFLNSQVSFYHGLPSAQCTKPGKARKKLKVSECGLQWTKQQICVTKLMTSHQ